MTTVAHAWMPVSPCGERCEADADRDAGALTVAVRATAIVLLLLSFPPTLALARARRRETVTRWFARGMLRALGIRLRIIDDRGVGDDDGALVVAGHVSWLDVVVLAAVRPSDFVARADLVAWPLVGGLARRMRIIPIERERLRELPGVVDEIGVRLAAGRRVAVFPEGTTWCGRAYGSLRPALFQAAIDTQTPVQPVRLRYLDARGVLTTRPRFVGADSLLASLRRVLRTRGMTAEAVLVPVQAPGRDRRELAARCERAIRGEVRFHFAGHTGAHPAALAPTPAPARAAG
jgi:1-acyl-sn-glycerol-3-phosphate acyltransferase